MGGGVVTPRINLPADEVEEIAHLHGLTIELGESTAHLVHEGVEYVATYGGAA